MGLWWNIFRKKCLSGINGFNQTTGIPRFRCEKCDFDLCKNCFNYYKEKDNYELNKFYNVGVHPHPLLFIGLNSNNGWGCDGRNLEKKSLSGINCFNQTNGIPRFRCEQWDFDLCKKCMDYYLS